MKQIVELMPHYGVWPGGRRLYSHDGSWGLDQAHEGSSSWILLGILHMIAVAAQRELGLASTHCLRLLYSVHLWVVIGEG